MVLEMLIEVICLLFVLGEDFKRVDIWFLGMILFVLLNFCVKYFYFDEI